MSAFPELDLIARHTLRARERRAPLRDAERTELANHAYGVGFEGLTMYELLRSARPEHPELLHRLVWLTAMTYRRGAAAPKTRTAGTRSDHKPRTPAPSPVRASGGIVEYGSPVGGTRVRGVEYPGSPTS